MFAVRSRRQTFTPQYSAALTADLSLAWAVDGTQLHVEVVLQREGWLSLGFHAPGGGMTNSLALILSPTATVPLDEFTISGRSSAAIARRTTGRQLLEFQWQQADGVTTMECTLDVAGGTPAVASEVTFLWAYGASNSFIKHLARAPFTINLTSGAVNGVLPTPSPSPTPTITASPAVATTALPSASATPSPSRTPSPTPAFIADHTASLDSALSMRWRFVGGNFTAQVTLTREAWVAYAFRTGGNMPGSDAVLLSPLEAAVRHVRISGRSAADVQAVPAAENMLLDSTYAVADGTTTLQFTLAAAAVADAAADTDALWAYGTSTAFSLHDERRAVKINYNTGKVTSEWDVLHVTHGAIMVVAWAVLIPMGIFSAAFCPRHANRHRHAGKPLWFTLHRWLQVLGVLSTVASAALVYTTVKGDHLSRTHHRLGLGTLILAVLQPLNAVIRPSPPRRGHPRSRCRCLWEVVHKPVGYFAAVVGLYTIDSGLHTIEPPTSSQTRLLYRLYVGVLAGAWLILSLSRLRSCLAPAENVDLDSAKSRDRHRRKDHVVPDVSGDAHRGPRRSPSRRHLETLDHDRTSRQHHGAAPRPISRGGTLKNVKTVTVKTANAGAGSASPTADPPRKPSTRALSPSPAMSPGHGSTRDSRSKTPVMREATQRSLLSPSRRVQLTGRAGLDGGTGGSGRTISFADTADASPASSSRHSDATRKDDGVRASSRVSTRRHVDSVGSPAGSSGARSRSRSRSKSRKHKKKKRKDRKDRKDRKEKRDDRDKRRTGSGGGDGNE